MKVTYWDVEDNYQKKESEREYEMYSVKAAVFQTLTYEHGAEVKSSLELYVDEETGMVVQDIAKYERWLRENS